MGEVDHRDAAELDRHRRLQSGWHGAVGVNENRVSSVLDRECPLALHSSLLSRHSVVYRRVGPCGPKVQRRKPPTVRDARLPRSPDFRPRPTLRLSHYARKS